MSSTGYQFIIYGENASLSSALNRYFNKDTFPNYSIEFFSSQKTLFNNAKCIDSIELDDKIASFFATFLCDSKEVHSGFTLFEPEPHKFKLKPLLDELKAKIDVYSSFRNKIKETFEGQDEDCELKWNNFNLKINGRVNKTIIYLFNIHSGTKDLWIKLGNSILKDGIDKNIFYIFYSFLEGQNINRINKDAVETNDKLWGYSRFLRDLLKAREKGFEIIFPLTHNGDIDKKILDKIKIIKEVIKKEKITIKFKDESIKLNESIINLYGDIIEVVNYEVLIKLYLHNRNKHCDDLEEIQKSLFNVDKKIISDTDSHGVLHYKDDIIFKITKGNITEKEQEVKNLGRLEYWYNFRKDISPLLNAFIYYQKFNKKLSFLFIDDNFTAIENKVEVIKKWFKDSTVDSTIKNFDWKVFFSNEFTKENTSNNLSILDIKLKLHGGDEKSINDLKPTFIIIDLDYNGQLVGIDLLRKFRDAIRDSKDLTGKTQLITLSRYESPYIIRTAINNGALYYITKSNFLRIIPKIFQLELDGETGHDYENWHQLYKLDPQKILQLKSTRNKIIGNDYQFFEGIEKEKKDVIWKNNYEYRKEYQWIKKLPKADLHCHIGSCMGSGLLPKTAFLVLAEKYQNMEIKELKYRMKLIIEFLLPIVLDLKLNEKLNPKNYNYEDEYKDELTEIFRADDKDYKVDKQENLFNIVFKYLSKNKIRKTPEEVVLSPEDNTLNRIEYNLEASNEKEKSRSGLFFNRRNELRKEKVIYAEVMLIFIIILYLRKESFNLDKLNYLKKELDELFKIIKNYDKDFKQPDIEKFLIFFKPEIENYSERFKEFNKGKEKNIEDDIIKFLQSAHSVYRCLADGNGSLFNYLRGAEYGGAEHLQTKAAIYLTTKFIIEEYAVKDNIRYLDLRCAVDGYAKIRLQTQEEAMESLLKGFDYFSKGKNVHVNIIITAKRHKSEKEFINNVNLALRYRYGLAPNEDVYRSKYKDKPYFYHPSRVVSFDLAGLEKGNRPSKFYSQFLPLLKDCFPITIHAGEEDDYESIWEAIYLVQSQRIGHGLTLRENIDLLKIARERHITIELCPISNLLTREEKYHPLKYLDEQKPVKVKPDKEETQSHIIYLDDSEDDIESKVENKKVYPLRQYLNANLDVTINTDNPVINDANLTEEYLLAAKMIGGISRWEILRIIKNSFRGAAIPKPEKRKLMNEIDSEIYEILLNED